jgi:hypothetical protein
LPSSQGTDAEALGDRVRERIGQRAVEIENLQVLSVTPAEATSPQAVARLGINPGGAWGRRGAPVRLPSRNAPQPSSPQGSCRVCQTRQTRRG